MEYMKFPLKIQMENMKINIVIFFFPQKLNLEDGKIIPQKLKRKMGK